MKHVLTVASLVLTLSTAALGQTWQRPPGCLNTEERLALAKQTGAVTILSTTAEECTQLSCRVLKVNVTRNLAENTCTAEVDVGLLRLRPRGERRVAWAIEQTPGCRLGGCFFDGANGITILSDPAGQLTGTAPVYTDITFRLTNKNDVPLAVVAYEPHVFWKRGSGQFVSCCPIDPKMINDN